MSDQEIAALLLLLITTGGIFFIMGMACGMACIKSETSTELKKLLDTALLREKFEADLKTIRGSKR